MENSSERQIYCMAQLQLGSQHWSLLQFVVEYNFFPPSFVYICLSPAAAKHMTTDSDFAHASAEAGTAYIVMLAIESMLAIVNGLEALTLEATQAANAAGKWKLRDLFHRSETAPLVNAWQF